MTQDIGLDAKAGYGHTVIFLTFSCFSKSTPKRSILKIYFVYDHYTFYLPQYMLFESKNLVCILLMFYPNNMCTTKRLNKNSRKSYERNMLTFARFTILFLFKLSICLLTCKREIQLGS